MPVPRPLPDSPDLDQLRKQAKDLLRAARAGDATASSRFRALPSFANASDDELARAPLALHDAQSVIAREHGFLSWNALRERVEELTLGFDDAVRELVEAATDGRTSRAERLLALHQRIAGARLQSGPGGGDVATLELLHAHGASPNQRWATDGSATLYAILHWSRTAAGVQWLLEHGADADPVFAVNGETPLHVAARLWDVALVESLVQRGADVSRRRTDGRTPYALAMLNGNAEVAEWLRLHGAPDDLAPVDRLVAACGRGNRAAVEAMLAERPSLRDEITDAHYATLHRAAEQGDVAVLELLLDCGFDPSHGDEEIGKTALHSAAMAGQPESVRLLLARGASPHVRDREFNGQPLVWAAEGSRSHDDRARDYAEVGRLLLRAGSTVEWQLPTEEPTEGIGEILARWQRDADGTRGAMSPASTEG
jgi:ankyrin repeat protein